jgi:CHASE3 domain sensor protein
MVNELLFAVAVLLVLGIAVTTYYSIKKVKIPPVL